jgi:hypothetical protein
LTDNKGKKPLPGPDLPSCFDSVDEKNIFELTTVGQETTTDRRTGEVRGPFHVAAHIKAVGKDGAMCSCQEAINQRICFPVQILLLAINWQT